VIFFWLCLGLLVDGSDVLALEGFSLAFMVVCLIFFLELVRFLHCCYHLLFKSRLFARARWEV
jgi:hypothetical protein